MSNIFDLTTEQENLINQTPGFVKYTPYQTVIPAYNLNAVQAYLLENRAEMEDLKDKIEENKTSSNSNLNQLEKNLNDKINNLDKRVDVLESHSKTYKATISTSWNKENLPYTQKITVNGIKATDNPIIWLDLEGVDLETAQSNIEEWPLIGRIVAGDNSLTAYCYEDDVPAKNIKIMVKVVKDIG